MNSSIHILTLALSLLMVFPLASCGGAPAGSPSGDPQPATTPATQPVAPPADGATSKPADTADTKAPAEPSESVTGTPSEPETVPETEPETQPAPAFTWEKTPEGLNDFTITVSEEKKEFRILQLTDLQSIYLPGAAKGTLRQAQLTNAFFADGVKDRSIRVYNYVRRAVAEAQPDFILLTGDNVYGETDDSGILWHELIDLMNEIGLPWGFVFGNHDNESMKGVRWQVSEALALSPLCLFAEGTERGITHGHSNYSILLEKDGAPRFQLFLLDSNGCKEIPSNPGEGLDKDNPDYDLITQGEGIWADQRNWFRSTAKGVSEAAEATVPSLVFLHHPLVQVANELEARGVELKYPLTLTGEGEFGVIRTSPGSIDRKGDLFKAMKEVGTVGVFFGHQHKNSASILSEGIRLTFGLKASTDAEYVKESLGSTLITLDLDTQEMRVEHLYQEYTKKKME